MSIRKGLSFVLALSILWLVLSSCATVSNHFGQSNIRVVTNSRVVEGMHFINGWSTEAGSQYTAQSVGDMVANDLGKRGSHDISILVELRSRGTQDTANMWTISIYAAWEPRSKPGSSGAQ